MRNVAPIMFTSQLGLCFFTTNFKDVCILRVTTTMVRNWHLCTSQVLDGGNNHYISSDGDFGLVILSQKGSIYHYYSKIPETD